MDALGRLAREPALDSQPCMGGTHLDVTAHGRGISMYYIDIRRHGLLYAVYGGGMVAGRSFSAVYRPSSRGRLAPDDPIRDDSPLTGTSARSPAHTHRERHDLRAHCRPTHQHALCVYLYV